ncbi:MAG TPA: helix-turn-helix transcriptional regulator [Blastocatellia bacterium]|jgi:transcriptional regulator with XRE-family HTH domain|nr:helix-turn-helix transcriptional regulator [Blastocatellia bacterium]
MGVRARKRQKKLAGKLKTIRESLGLTQKDLLNSFKIDWLHQSNISSYELGATEPPLSVIEKYAEVANVCMDVLISDKHELPDKLPAKKLYHPH